MTAPSSKSGYAVTVWVRDTLSYSWDDRSSIEDRLRELVTAGVLTDVTVRVWGKRISTDPDDDCRTVGDIPIRETLRRFRDWAADHDCSLEPGFQTRERRSLLTDETTSIVVPPIACLAVYDADTLVGVFPCSTGETTVTVADCLNELETSGTHPLSEPIEYSRETPDQVVDTGDRSEKTRPKTRTGTELE